MSFFELIIFLYLNDIKVSFKKNAVFFCIFLIEDRIFAKIDAFFLLGKNIFFIFLIEILSYIIDIALFCYFYKKYLNINKIVSFLLCLYLIKEIIAQIVIYFIDIKNESVYGIFLTGCSYGIIFFIMKFLIQHNVFNKENWKVVGSICLYVFISIRMFLVLIIISNNPKKWFDYMLIFSILQFFIFICFLYMSERHHKIEMLNRQLVDYMRLKKSQDKYMHNLEESELKIRRFRHDYKNLLASLYNDPYINSEALEKLRVYSSNILDDPKLFKFKNLEKVKVKTVKNILLEKFSELNDYKIEYVFECDSYVVNIPILDELDFVRIVGIVMDNAVEEVKGLNNDNKKEILLRIMLYQRDDELEFIVKNRYDTHKSLDIVKLTEKGYTLKKGHGGMGLSNIQEMNSRYPEMGISYKLNDGWFEFDLII